MRQSASYTASTQFLDWGIISLTNKIKKELYYSILFLDSRKNMLESKIEKSGEQLNSLHYNTIVRFSVECRKEIILVCFGFGLLCSVIG